MTVQEQQEQFVPTDDLTPYAGQWVAIRGGRVVAASLDAVSLRDDPEVRDDDLLTPVPSGDAGLFIL